LLNRRVTFLGIIASLLESNGECGHTAPGTAIPALRQARKPCTWVIVTEPSSASPLSLAET